MTDMTRRARPCLPRRAAHGIVLLALLLVLALMGIALMAAVDVWSVTRQREREEELMFVGDQYRQAIQRYYYAAPGGARVLPASLQALLDDDRYPVPIHHLRRLYPDPITGTTDWGLLQVGDRIMGVYSNSEAVPLKQAGFALMYQHFAEQGSYRAWVFAFVAARRGAAAAAPPASAAAVPDFNPAPPKKRQINGTPS